MFSTTIDESQQASMQNLKNKIGQLAIALNNRLIGRLPSDTQVLRMRDKKECKAVELRRGKKLHDPY